MGSKQYAFALQLSNGLRWQISTTFEELQSWIEQMGVIMRLDNSCTTESNRNLICSISKDSHDDVSSQSAQHELAAKGWKLHDMGKLCFWYHEHLQDVLCTIKPFTNQKDAVAAMQKALYPIYRETIRSGGTLFHAALIEHDGKGVILAGGHGAGKSTCCSRLPNNWSALCDDQVLVLVDSEGQYRAHPFPTWSEYLNGISDKTWNVEHSIPVHGIFFIEQSDIDASMRVGKGESIAFMNESSLQLLIRYLKIANEKKQRLLRRNLFDNCCEMAKKIPAFKLQVSRHGRFWEEIERSLG
ncbi:MAG: SynChlorMet cassette protein ScmC [Chlorobiaceae bacterium]